MLPRGHPFVLVLFLVLFPSPSRSAPDVDSATLLADAALAESRFDPATALVLYRRAATARPDDPLLLQKIARQLSDLSDDAPTAGEKQRLLTEALALSHRAVELAPDNAVNLLSVAICYGKLANIADTRTRIEYSRALRDYAQRALAADPSYAYAHHLLGRWHHEVATLGATKRFLVRLIYGALPPASKAEAIRHLQRAVELEPDSPSHRVELGFVLLADGQTAAAQRTLAEALAIPPKERHDTAALRRARTALHSLPR